MRTLNQLLFTCTLRESLMNLHRCCTRGNIMQKKKKAPCLCIYLVNVTVKVFGILDALGRLDQGDWILKVLRGCITVHFFLNLPSLPISEDSENRIRSNSLILLPYPLVPNTLIRGQNEWLWKEISTTCNSGFCQIEIILKCFKN